MKTTDRVLSFLLALVMIFSLFPGILAYAQSPEETVAPVEAPDTAPDQEPEPAPAPGEPDEPVGDGDPDVPPEIVPQSDDPESSPDAGEIDAMPPEDGAESLIVFVSGVVYASELEENSSLQLTEDTELRMDVARTLEYISGSHALTITGSGFLTVNNPNNDFDSITTAINVGSLVSSVSMDIRAPHGSGIVSAQDITITGGVTVNVSSALVAISAENNIEISVSALAVNSGFDGLNSSEGTISVSANSLVIEAGQDAIEAYRGAVTVNVSGTGIVKSTFHDTTGFYTGGRGITASDDISLGGGGTLTINSPHTCLLTQGSLRDTGLSLDLTSTEYKAISTEGSVTVTGASLLKVSSGDTGVYAKGSIYISVASLTVNSGYDGLNSSEGTISVSANSLVIEAGQDAIEAYRGAVTVNVSGTGIVKSTFHDTTGFYTGGRGITASDDISLGGGGTLTINSPHTCLLTQGSLRDTGLSLDLTSTEYKAISTEGSVTITGAFLLKVSSGDTGVYAKGSIYISVASMTVNAEWDGIYSYEGESLSVSADNLAVEAKMNGIHAYSGTVTVNVSVTGTVKSTFHDTSGMFNGGFGITASGDISLGGVGTLTINSPYTCILTSGSLRDTGLSLDLTSTESKAISTEGSVTITDASLLKVSSGDTGVYANGSISISVAALTVNSVWHGLCSSDGAIDVSAYSLAIEAGENCIYAYSGTVTVNVAGTGTVTRKDVFLIGNGGYGVRASGDISLGGGGTLTVESPFQCIRSDDGRLLLENGLTLYATTADNSALYASEGIVLGDALILCFPQGGSVGNLVIDAYGQVAPHVVIGTPLTGTLTIEGGATEYAYGETISVISSGLPTASEYMWQVSEDGENWTDLEPGEARVYSDSVIRIKRTARLAESDQYFRLVASCPHYVGQILSPAVHVKQAFKVRYYPNGGSGSMDNVGAWKNAGETFTLHQNTFTPPERKSFKAWRIDGMEYQPGDTITISGDTYIYAVWQTSEWLIQFSPGSGSGASGSMAPMTVPCGESFTLPACSFTPPEGKTFSRWWLGGNRYYAPGDRITPNSNEVVVAEWRSNRTVVGFDPNGGRGSMNPVQLTPEEALAYTLPECTYNPPEDHVFDKWEVIDRNSGDSYFALPGDEVRFTSYSITLKAIWALKPSFEVSFDANGHGTAPLPQSVMQDHYAQDPGALSAEGYTFLGWYTEAAGTNRFDFAATKITGPTTLYAKWMDKITAIEISDFVFPEAGMRSVPSARITTGNRAYVCTGIEWRWPASNFSYGYAVSYTPMTFEPSTEYTAVITLETVRDYRFDTGEAPERVTINGETVNVDLTRSGYVSDTKYQLYTVPVLTEDLIPIDEAHFPDDAFRAVLRGTRYDLNQDGYFSRSEIGVITELNLSQKNIASLEGIGCLSELKTLNAVDNALTTLDLSDKWMLETVYCSLNANLTELLLPKNAWLKWLQCYGCALTGLDLRGITYLSYAAATTPTISANGQQATYRYMVNGVKTAEMILDASVTLYDSYVKYARVRFDPGIGSGTMPSVMADKTLYYKLPANAFTAPEDMYFNGWKLGDTVYAAGATMDRLFAADENEVIFVAQWKSAAALSITVPDATLRPNSNGYSVSLDYSEGTLSGGKWLTSYSTSSMEENVVADSLLPNTRVYAAIRFPTTVSVSSLRNQLTRGTLVVKNAQVEDVASYLEGTRTRTFLIVSVLPRSITVSFRNGGGSGIMAPVTGRIPGSSYTLPACSFTAPADMVFDRWSMGAPGSSITLNEDITLIARWKVADGAIPVTEDYFPDPAFRAYVSQELDTNHGGYLTPAEINAVTEISMEELGLTNVQGIEYFTQLETLVIARNRDLTSLDLTANTKLELIRVWNNGLTELKLTGLSQLHFIECDGNQLRFLDVTGLPLTELYTYHTPMGALILGSQPQLRRLDCYGSGGALKVLDIRECPILLDAYANEPSSIDGLLDIYEGSLGGMLKVDHSAEILTPDCISVDPSHFPDPAFLNYVAANFDTNLTQWLTPKEIQAAKEINCSGMSALESLQGIEYFTELETLNCSRCGLHGILDLSLNWKLRSVNCGDNSGLDDLNLIGLTSLEELRCTNCGNLSDPDLSSNGALRLLHLANCQLSNLDLSQNPQLSDLDVSDNYLTSLDLSHNKKLLSLTCYSCEITALDLRANTRLKYLDCDGMESLQSLDVSGLTSLEHLDVSDCSLTALDVSDCALILLECDHNPLHTLILGRQADLESLYCYAVDLAKLDIRGCPILEDAWINGTHTTYEWGLEVHNAEGLGGYMELDKDQIVLADGQVGDVNRDGAVNALDLIQLRKYLVGLETSPSFDLLAANVNGDSAIDILDLVRLRKLLA